MATGPVLLDSYELERRPAALRNTGYPRDFAESLGHLVPQEGLEDDSPVGEQLRRDAGQALERHGRVEFDIPGITFGTRDDRSPVVVSDGSHALPDAANRYEPTASPGGRAPHLWLGERRSLFDAFNFEWTLLRLGKKPPDARRLVRAASRLGLDLKVLDIPSDAARELYQAPLALIRPHQIVAWRGVNDADAQAALTVATGYATDGNLTRQRLAGRSKRAQERSSAQ